MKKLLAVSAWSFWLGFGLTYFFHAKLNDWKFYVFLIILIILVELSHNTRKND